MTSPQPDRTVRSDLRLVATMTLIGAVVVGLLGAVLAPAGARVATAAIFAGLVVAASLADTAVRRVLRRDLIRR